MPVLLNPCHNGIPTPPMQYEHDSHCPLPLHDPAAVDLRAFYPYTPNEVKHRRRTTSAQLKVLEAVFRVDTKPNATLRNDLAAQLGMTSRGTQVCVFSLFLSSNPQSLPRFGSRIGAVDPVFQNDFLNPDLISDEPRKKVYTRSRAALFPALQLLRLAQT